MSTKLTLCDDMQNRVEVSDDAGVSVLVFRNTTDKERRFAMQVVKRWNAYDALVAELQNIANADANKWEHPSDFKTWAQSRARFVLTGTRHATGESTL